MVDRYHRSIRVLSHEHATSRCHKTTQRHPKVLSKDRHFAHWRFPEVASYRILLQPQFKLSSENHEDGAWFSSRIYSNPSRSCFIISVAKSKHSRASSFV